MRTTTSASRSATKRCAVAAAGFGMVLASFAGVGSATAATQHPLSGHISPHIVGPATTLGATSATPVQIPAATLAAGTSVALPTITITDPGILTSGQTVTLSLYSSAQNVRLDTTATPGVTPSGASTGAVTVTNGAVSFTVTKSATTNNATYVVSGIKLVGTAAATFGALGVAVSTSGSGTQPGVSTFNVGAVTRLIPADYGPTAPDTAAAVFARAYGGGSTSAVLASDYEPQDAESANYLVAALAEGNARTGILLTDPTTLSPAASDALAANTAITTIYIVGGTSVVSAAIQTQLEAHYTVIRLAGVDQYATNEFVVNYVASRFGASNATYPVDYTKTQYNDTSGTSSPTTTDSTPTKTAIVASGSIDSFQDGIVSGPLSVEAGLPVILTTPTSLSATALALLTTGSYKQVILLGGPSAVSNSVEAQLTASTQSGGAGVTVFRIAGQDASDTSTKLASFLLGSFAPIDIGGTTFGGVLITRGTGFQDALATGPYAGTIGRTPILLTENATTLGAPLTAYLKSLGQECIYSAQAVGGPLSVGPAVQTAAIDAEFSGLTGCSSLTAVGGATVTAPTAPTLNSVTNGIFPNAVLNFSAPTSDGGSAITGYQYSVDGGAWTDLPAVTGPGPYTATVANSPTVGPYVYRVRAVNSAGDSAASNPVTFTQSS